MEKNLVDKFAEKMINVFLAPLRKLKNKSSSNDSVQVKTSDKPDVSSQTTQGVQSNSLEEKARVIGQTKRLPDIFNSNMIRKGIILMTLVLVVLIIISFVMNFASNRPKDLIPTRFPGEETVSQEPSLYATDDDVLELEDAINVLDRELANYTPRDTSLNVPQLDFNVSF